MKPYKNLILLQERRLPEYKAWFRPESNWFLQFGDDEFHGDIAEKVLGFDEHTAIRKGYYRIYVGREIDIDSKVYPSDQEFNSTKYAIEAHSYKKFSGVRWDITGKKGYYFFKNQSFLFADSLDDAEYRKY